MSVVWDPGTLLRCADWFFRKGDPSTGNKITFKDSAGMFSPFASRQISMLKGKRDALLAWCPEIAIGEIGGRTVRGGVGVPTPVRLLPAQNSFFTAGSGTAMP